MPHYQTYAAGGAWVDGYNRYQSKYKTTPRKSDVVLASIVNELEGSGPLRLLDIGCSTGNLLRTIKLVADGRPMSYVGADISKSSIDEASRDPDLGGIDFHLWDVNEIPQHETFDVIVMSAVAYIFDDASFSKMLRSVYSALRPGGTFIAFELVCDLPDYRLTIEERSPFYDGKPHYLNIRSKNMVEREMLQTGFDQFRLMPFSPPQMPRPPDDAYLTSYTIDVPEDGPRSVRGYIITPWAFAIATKSLHPGVKIAGHRRD